MTPPSSVVIWGAAGHARVLRELLSSLGLQLLAIFDTADVASPFADVPLYIGREGFLRWRAQSPDGVGGLVAIGGSRGRERLELQEFFAVHGVRPIAVVHPRAFVADNARIGDGSQVLAHATVAADVRVGAACIVNHSANVDHECELGDGVHIAPGAVLAGCVRIGRHALVGAGAVILPRIQVGADAIIGAGAVVTRDVPDGAVVVGSPARIAYQQPASPNTEE